MDAIWLAAKKHVEIVEHLATVSEARRVIALLWVPEPEAARLQKETESQRQMDRSVENNHPTKQA